MRINLLWYMVLALLLVGCSNEQSENPVLVEQNLVHLSNGTPKPAKEYFKGKIAESDGGLHTFNYETKTYLMLFEPNRQIRQIQEFTDHMRVITTFNDGAGTFNKDNEINQVLYIKMIDKVEKPFTVIREEELDFK